MPSWRRRKRFVTHERAGIRTCSYLLKWHTYYEIVPLPIPLPWVTFKGYYFRYYKPANSRKYATYLSRLLNCLKRSYFMPVLSRPMFHYIWNTSSSFSKVTCTVLQRTRNPLAIAGFLVSSPQGTSVINSRGYKLRCLLCSLRASGNLHLPTRWIPSPTKAGTGAKQRPK